MRNMVTNNYFRKRYQEFVENVPGGYFVYTADEKEMIIGIDIDDTICSTNESIIEEADKYDKQILEHEEDALYKIIKIKGFL